MQSFKQYYTEAVDLSTAKRHIKNQDYKDFRNDVFEGSDRIILPTDVALDNVVDDRTARDIGADLTYFGFGFDDTMEDYSKGFTYPRKSPDYKELRNLKFDVKRGGTDYPRYNKYELDLKNKFKVGKVLSAIIKFLEKHPEDFRSIYYLDSYKDALKQFIEDPTRSKADINYKVVISRHPYDILGMSTDRNWTSCMNIGSQNIVYKKDRSRGAHAKMIPGFIKQKGLIAYLIAEKEINKESGKCKLQKPISRINLIPHVNANGEIAYGIGKMYGLRVPEFNAAVTAFVNNSLNINIKDDYYDIPKDVYHDIGTKTPGFTTTTRYPDDY